LLLPLLLLLLLLSLSLFLLSRCQLLCLLRGPFFEPGVSGWVWRHRLGRFGQRRQSFQLPPGHVESFDGFVSFRNRSRGSFGALM
jgi:hypothetical protein